MIFKVGKNQLDFSIMYFIVLPMQKHYKYLIFKTINKVSMQWM